jgi:hypothetical protein
MAAGLRVASGAIAGLKKRYIPPIRNLQLIDL